VAFLGDASEIGVGDLLAVIAQRGHTGRLTIVSDTNEVHIYLESGKITLISATAPSLRFGAVILRLGVVEPSKLNAAIRQQDLQGGKRALGQILLDSGWITPEHLERAAEEQCVEALTQVIVANRGTFTFARDLRSDIQRGIVDLNTSMIVLEASRRADEMLRLRSLLPSPTTPLLIVNQKVAADATVLTEYEQKIMDQLASEAYTLDDLGNFVLADRATLWRAVATLYERGLIAVNSDNERGSRPVAEAAPARTVEELVKLSKQKPSSASAKLPTLNTVRSGKPASSQSIAAVTIVAREAIASFNTGLTLRAFASFSDDHFRRMGPLSADRIAELRSGAVPLPPEVQETFLGVREVRLLNDGRISAIVHTFRPAEGETKKVMFFTRATGCWQIDAIIEVANPGATTLTAMLSAPNKMSPLSNEALRAR
jgi:Domain of unknown function (DUF4388)